jgi:hypothetical protein
MGKAHVRAQASFGSIAMLMKGCDKSKTFRRRMRFPAKWFGRKSNKKPFPKGFTLGTEERS